MLEKCLGCPVWCMLFFGLYIGCSFEVNGLFTTSYKQTNKQTKTGKDNCVEKESYGLL